MPSHVIVRSFFGLFFLLGLSHSVQAELITPLHAPIGAEVGPWLPGGGTTSLYLTDEYRSHGLLFPVRIVPPYWRYSTTIGRFGASEQRVWVGASQFWHIPPEPFDDKGYWQNAIDYSAIDVSLTAPADALRVSFVWGNYYGEDIVATAQLTAFTHDGRSIVASTMGAGSATVVLDAPGIERLTASVSSEAEIGWGVSGIEVRRHRTPEPSSVALALLAGTALLAQHLRRSAREDSDGRKPPCPAC